MGIQADFPLGEFQQRLETYERRYGDGEVLWRTDLLSVVSMWRTGRDSAHPTSAARNS